MAVVSGTVCTPNVHTTNALVQAYMSREQCPSYSVLNPLHVLYRCVTVFDKDCDVTAVTRDNGDKCYQCALSTTGVAVSKTGTREPMHIIITVRHSSNVPAIHAWA